MQRKNGMVFFKKKRVNFIGLLMSFLLLCGCSGSDGEPVENIFTKDIEGRKSMLENPSVDYELPGVYPAISVDLMGYEVGRKKIAVLAASRLPAFYEVRDSQTGKVVYEGGVKRKNVQSDSEISVGTVDFSGFNTPGTYYIETEILGRSKDFSIVEDVYQSMLTDAYSKLRALRCDGCHGERIPFEQDKSSALNSVGGWHTSAEGEKDVVESCLAVMDLCTIYEFYPKIFSDDYGSEDSGNRIPDILDEAFYEANWLFTMQNKESGGVYASISLDGDKGSDSLCVRAETTRATAYYCACMAKVSFVSKRFNQELSNKAMQAAVLAWNTLEANKSIVDSDQMFRAASELFRLTGQDVYKKVVNDFLSANADKPYESRSTLDGAITYLSSARATDVGFCTLLMNNLMKHTEGKVADATASKYLVEADEAEVSDVLRTAYEFAIVDYINSSIEYVNGEEDCLHYVGGRNAYSINYFDSIDTPDSLVKIIAVAARLSASDDK